MILKPPTQQGFQQRHQYINISIMLVNCKILSSDFLINQKIENFIKSTPFFYLQENSNDFENNQIIFWDIDTINIDILLIKERITEGSIILLISSLISKSVISEMFGSEIFRNISVLTKNVAYSQFVDEVSQLIENRAFSP